MLDVKKWVAKVSEKLNAIGTAYTASWSATSTNTAPARVTGNITVPKGTYVVFLKIPYCSQSTSLYFGLSIDSTVYGSGFLNQDTKSWLVTLTDTTTFYAVTGMSANTSYTYRERGWLKAVKIA